MGVGREVSIFNEFYLVIIVIKKVPECELVKINKFPGPGSYNNKYDKFSSA